MNHLFNPDWNYIITFLGLFLSILPLILSINLKFTKALDIASQNCKTEIQPADENNRLRKLHRIEIVLFNYGNDVIYKSDIFKRFKIDVKKLISFESLRIQSTCEFVSVDYIINNSEFEFTFDFLEPNKFIKIELNYFSYDEIDAFFYGKIIGGNKLDCELNRIQTWENNYWLGRKEVRAFKAFIITFIGLSAFSYMTILRMFNLRSSDLLSILLNFNRDSLLIFIFLFFILVPIFLISRRIYKLYLPFSLHAKKEKTWHPKVDYSL